MNKKTSVRDLHYWTDNLKSKIENLKWVGIIAVGFTFAICGAVAQAQQAGKIFRIGRLDVSTASGGAVLWEAFRGELSKFGWIEGKNITIEYRFAEQKFERLPELAAELVRLKVDIIVATGRSPALAAKGATYHSHRDDCPRPRGRRFDCRSGAAGRQCHGSLEFINRAKYQKARDTQRHTPQAR
jgi:hypothetical protein